MQVNENTLLQITDTTTGKRCALRVYPNDVELPLSALLDTYVKRPSMEDLRREGRITEDSAETLVSLQDLLFLSDDEGRLRDIFAGVVFTQGSTAVALDQPLRSQSVRISGKEALVLDVAIDRTNVGYDRNWVGFNKRRWDAHSHQYDNFVRSCVEQACGLNEAREVLRLDSTTARLRFVEVLARRVWESDFENYSRFIGRKLAYKSGDETVRSMIGGSGGICSEKVQALKFFTDHYGLRSEYILSGPNVPGPVPETRLRELLTTFDFRFAQREMRYWQHIALLYTIDGAEVLVDSTNGNIPFLFIKGPKVRRLLGYDRKPSVKVRMAVNRESFYYHKVSQDIPQDLFFAMEGWVQHVDLVQVFDNELGLSISSDFMVTPIVFRSQQGFDKMGREYEAACRRAGLDCTVSDQWDLESPLGSRFAELEPVTARKVIQARDHLLVRYDDCHGAGHDAGLVVIALRGPRSRASQNTS